MCIYCNDEGGICCKDKGIDFINFANNKKCPIFFSETETCPNRVTISDVKVLERRLAESADREQRLMLQLGERDKRLAEAEKEVHKYLNMISDLQMERNSIDKQMKEDTNRFIEEQNRANLAEFRLRAALELAEKIKIECLKKYDDEPEENRLSFVYDDIPYLYELEAELGGEAEKKP